MHDGKGEEVCGLAVERDRIVLKIIDEYSIVEVYWTREILKFGDESCIWQCAIHRQIVYHQQP